MRRYRGRQGLVGSVLVVLIIACLDELFKAVGGNHPSRKQEYHQVYLQSDHWKRVRNTVGQDANWECEVRGCGRYGHNLNAHHLHYRSLGEEREGDVVYVCPYHHKLIHKNNAFNRKGGGIIPAFSYR